MESSIYEAAARLTKHGFHIVPVRPNSKAPYHDEWYDIATNDWEKAKKLLKPNDNVGISMDKYNGSQGHLATVDIDDKVNGEGSRSIIEWELEGKILPQTYEQLTASGTSRHMTYLFDFPVHSSTKKLAPGIDIVGWHGQIVGAGSRVNGGIYRGNFHKVVPAPEWLIAMVKRHQEREIAPPPVPLDFQAAKVARAAEKAAIEFLTSDRVPIAVEHVNGNNAAYLVAAQLKDFGCTEESALELMLEHWNEKCLPPWSAEELEVKVRDAFTYGKNPQGVLNPHGYIEPVAQVEVSRATRARADQKERAPARAEAQPSHPLEILCHRHAFVLTKTRHHIMWDDIGHNGQRVLRTIDEKSFHAFYASWLKDGEPYSKIWIASKDRTTYRGYFFDPRPGAESPGYYNLWQGFHYKPLGDSEKPTKTAEWAVKEWLNHIHENVCQGNAELAKWLIAWIAHIFQKPWEKPHTSVALRGEKGVGKNAVADRIIKLLGPLAVQVGDSERFTGRFNSLLENKMFFVLNEAFWSGNKKAEGILKTLITEKEFVVEYKFGEPFVVPNLVRLFIMGNEDWLVPATADERRYAVFELGRGRQEDKAYFKAIQEGIEGPTGYQYLMRTLLEVDTTSVDVNRAPFTKALLLQKELNKDPLGMWWKECLEHGEILHSNKRGWPDKLDTNLVLNAFTAYAGARGMKSWVNSIKFGLGLRKFCPSLGRTKVRVDHGTAWHYVFPVLDVARQEWDRYMRLPEGMTSGWNDDDQNRTDIPDPE